jgi:hypothetical protein
MDKKLLQGNKKLVRPRRSRASKVPEQDRAAHTAEIRADFEKRKRQQLARAAIEHDAIDAEIFRIYILHPTITQKAIGALVGRTRKEINKRMNAPKFKRAVEIANRSALEVFESNKARAARVLGEMLGSPDDRVKLRAAIAHMWPHIHADTKHTNEDFVSFIQEAYEAAEAKALAAAGSKDQA